MKASEDYYKVLQLDPSATPELVEKAFRVLSLKYHPDKNPASKKEWAEEKFRQLKDAYDTIIDPDKRKEYDTLLQKRQRKSKGPFFKTYDIPSASRESRSKYRYAHLTLEPSSELEHQSFMLDNEESDLQKFKKALELDLFNRLYIFLLNLTKLIPYILHYNPITKSDNRELLFILNHCLSILKMQSIRIFLSKKLNQPYKFYGIKNPIVVLNEKSLRQLDLIQKIHFIGYILGHVQFNHIYYLKLSNFVMKKQSFLTRILSLVIIGKFINHDLRYLAETWLRSAQNSAHRIGLFCTDDLESSQTAIIRSFELEHNTRNLTIENVLSYHTNETKNPDKRLVALSDICNDVKYFSRSLTFLQLSKERPRYLATCPYCYKTAKISYKNLMTKNISKIRCPFCNDLSLIK